MKEYDFIKIIKEITDTDLNIIGDDTAIIKDSGLVLTCDTLVENTHFSMQTTTPYDLGYNAGAVNLSDIATSGGKCNYLLVSLAMSKNIDEKFIKEFYTGLKYISDNFNTRIIGGDLTHSNNLVVTITAIGQTNVISSRSNAKPNQYLMTTGNYGASFLGLQLLEFSKTKKLSDVFNNYSNEINTIKNRHLKPYPRINEAQYFISSCKYDNYCIMDTSDGLADAVFQISQKSNKAIDIDVNAIPIDKSVKELAQMLHLIPEEIALYGGEDFELLFTCDESNLKELINNKNFKFTQIGRIKDAPASVKLIYKDKTIELNESLLEKKISFKHF